ncbi:MAG: HD domain-containing protein [Treponemataceae bacterium]
MISKQFALKIFEAFAIERWSDFVRPIDLIEMDKSAEKMMTAYILGKFEEKNGKEVNWHWMIYASLFELLKKIALCDIKAPIQRMIKKNYPAEYKKLNDWVLEQYKDLIDNELYDEFEKYLKSTNKPTDKPTILAKRIFRAAHKFSAMREFQLLSPVNEEITLQKVANDLYEDISEFLDLKGLQLLLTKQRPFKFLLMVEKLRYQVRWNQTPRIPKTSVLGHSFFVAILSLLLSRQGEIKKNPKRIYNNFFSALFHDLPEAVTRDIISPVKQATRKLPEIVKKIEDEIVNTELRPLMEDFFADELLYFTNDEFENRVKIDTQVCHKDFDEINKTYNEEKFDPVDGKLIRAADHIAAFLEADSSIQHGITSSHLTEGKNNLRKLYPSGNLINGCDISVFFEEG